MRSAGCRRSTGELRMQEMRDCLGYSPWPVSPLYVQSYLTYDVVQWAGLLVM